MHNMTCVYISGSGTEIDLLSFPFFISDMSPFFSYSHTITTSYGRIVGFIDEASKNVDIVINIANERRSESDFLADKERLFSVFESDIQNGYPGTLYVNGYSLRCYFVAESIENRFNEACQSQFTVIWEAQENWKKDLDDVITMNVVSNLQTTIRNPLPYGAHFRMTLRGNVNQPWASPSFSVGQNYYGLSETIPAGKCVVIDSFEKTVICDGSNWFGYLNRLHTPFGKIPFGNVSVIADSSASSGRVSLVLVDERRCPSWI